MLKLPPSVSNTKTSDRAIETTKHQHEKIMQELMKANCPQISVRHRLADEPQHPVAEPVEVRASHGGRKFETAAGARAAILKEPVSLFLLHVAVDIATMRVLDDNGPVSANSRFVWSELSLRVERALDAGRPVEGQQETPPCLTTALPS